MTESEKAQLVIRHITEQTVKSLGEEPTLIILLQTPKGGLSSNYYGQPLRVVGLAHLFFATIITTVKSRLGVSCENLPPPQAGPDLGAFGVDSYGLN